MVGGWPASLVDPAQREHAGDVTQIQSQMCLLTLAPGRATVPPVSLQGAVRCTVHVSVWRDEETKISDAGKSGEV